MSNPTSQLDFAISDADQHFYEAADSFTRHLEPKFRSAFQWVRTPEGRTRLLLGNQVFTMIGNPTFDPVGAPGALLDYFKGVNREGADAKKMIGKMEPIRPEYRSRERRVEVLRAQNVATTLMLPTLALGIEELMHGDPPALHALFSAFNRWIDDEWGFARDERIIAPAVMSLVDPQAAVAELERVLARGARAIVFRPAPVVGPEGSRSPADPIFDRFWAIAAEAGTLVGYHAADSGYAKLASQWGERSSFQTYNESPFVETLGLHIERPIQETMAALVCHGLFDRHPKLRVATIELGSGWVRDLLRRLALAYGKIPQTFAQDPVESFLEHVWVTPFMEDDVVELVETIGAENVLFGSDWPHPEGLARPMDFEDEARRMKPEDAKRVLSDNLRNLLGLAA